MNNFIFENSTRVYFGKGCVKEYLACLTSNVQKEMLAYGGGSIKKNGIYDEITGILNAKEKQIVDFSDIMPNPTNKKVIERAKFRKLPLSVAKRKASKCRSYIRISSFLF